jgi:hypothetical protein
MVGNDEWGVPIGTHRERDRATDKWHHQYILITSCIFVVLYPIVLLPVFVFTSLMPGHGRQI